MMAHVMENSQRTYARVAGAALLLIIVSGVATNHLVVSGDAAATAHNITTHEMQFRLGLIGEFVMLDGDVVLAVALYTVLKPVDPNLALLGAFWRFANAIVLGMAIIASLVALDFVGVGTRYLSAAHGLTAFKADQVHLLAMQFLDLHDTGMFVGLAFFSLGAATHSYLLWKSNYIPRVLSASYVVVSAIVLVSCLAIIMFPSVDARIDPWFILPDFIVEVVVALWLVLKGITIGPLHAS